MLKAKPSWLIALVMCALAMALAVTACGSDDDDSGDSGGAANTSEGGGESSKSDDLGSVAIVLTNPESSSFGQTAVTAAERIESELGNKVTVQGGLTAATQQQVFEGYAGRNTDLVIVHGAEMQQAAEQVAAKFPETHFVVINGAAKAAPNLSSATYAWEEVGFLAGVTAGTATESNKVGQMSSLEIPPIMGIYEGFVQGVKEVNPEATTVNSYTGSNTDPGKAASATSVQVSQGVDIVFTVATGADPGVFSTAKDKNIKVIGYGIDETNLGPNVILTSTLVNYSDTIFDMAKKFNDGDLEPTIYSYGFKDDAFSLAPIVNVPKSTANEIEKVADEAISGKFEIKPFEG